jgi:hypothetical protein
MESMEASGLLDELSLERVQLWTDGQALRYRAPPGAMTDVRRSLIRTNQVQLLELVRFRNRIDSVMPDAPGAEAIYAPTPVQTAILNEPLPLTIAEVRRWEGMDKEAFRQAFGRLLERHDALRTRFVMDSKGRPWAVVERGVEVPIEEVDLTTVPAHLQFDIFATFSREFMAKPFEREHGPLLRFAVVTFSASESVCVLVVCHSVFDRFSGVIFFDEFARLYHAARSGSAADLPDIQLKFHDYAVRLNRELQDDWGFGSLQFMWERLLGRRTTFTLPEDRAPAWDGNSGVPGSVPGLDRVKLAELRARVRSQQWTLFAAALTAFGISLAAWSGQGDAFTWVVDAARTRPDTARLIGLCGIHVAFPMHFGPDQTLEQAVQDVCATYREGLDYYRPAQSHAPISNEAQRRGMFLGVEFDYLVEELLENNPFGPELGLQTWIDTALHQEEPTFFSVRIKFNESRNGLAWSVSYKHSKFKAGTIDRFLKDVGLTLAAIINDPTQKIGSVLNDFMRCNGPPAVRRT